VRAVDHRFALGSSPAQSRFWAERPGQKIVHPKRLIGVNSPILACNVFTSIAGSAGSLWLSDPKTPAAPSRS